MLSATERAFTTMFLYLGAALIVDGIDGPLARRLKVATALPRWSGDALDFVVDFTTYVFVPAYAIAVSGLMPRPVSIMCAVVIVVTGALYFADREMKTPDKGFRGFPAVWNVVAFYLLVFQPGAAVAGGSIAALAALTFAPFEFIHPLRVTRGRFLNITLLCLWCALAGTSLWFTLEPPGWVKFGLAVTAIYFLLIGLAMRTKTA